MVAVTYRRADPADIALLARHHRAMFAEMRGKAGLTLQGNCCGPADCGRMPDFARLEQAQAEKLREQLTDGTCLAFVAEQAGEAVASGCLSVMRATPVPEDPSWRVGFLHSLFVEKELRGQGIGRGLVELLLDQGRRLGLRRIQLAASRQGRHLYEKMGFVALEHMVKWL
jgi:predicted N-acetyltransferase YhbS